MQATTDKTETTAGRRLFERILVGVDGSSRALEAARQAALLENANGQLTLVAAWETAPTTVGGTGTRVPPYYDERRQRQAAAEAVEAAREHLVPYAPATTRLVRGAPVAALLREIERERATLVAVGGDRIGRLRGIVQGTVATALVHRAPCSVLVARQARPEFPRRIVVGVDGSLSSAAALAAARQLAERFDATLQILVAWSGNPLDRRLVRAISGGGHVDSSEPPAEALLRAGRTADLLVVGSRGLHGLRALGSVSERVAHRAPCSVLVVRET